MPTAYLSESLSIDMPQLPEVIIDGHKVAPGSKDVVSEIYELLNMSNIAKMRKIMADQVPKGWVRPYNLNITPVGELIKLDEIGQAISIINDGPAQIQLGLNSRDHLIPLNNNQALNLNFRYHVLEWFYVICGPALTATARAVITG